MKNVIITSVTTDGVIVEREYDNKTCTFYENGEPVEIGFTMKDVGIEEKEEYVPSEDEVVEFQRQQEEYSKPRMTDSNRSNKKEHDINEIKLQLGLGCNFNCSYCKQHIHVNDAALSDMDDVEEYIRRFDEWCTVDKDQPMRVQLWGGEPLLYWNHVKRLVTFFRERFSHLIIGFVTNGSLMNEEKAKFLTEHNVGITVSHDGPSNNENRDKDPLAEGSESRKWIEWYGEQSDNRMVGVNAVISKNNLDVVGIVKYIKDVLGPGTPVNFEGVVSVEDADQFDEDSLFTDEDYAILRHNIKVGILSGDLMSSIAFRLKCQYIFSMWAENKEWMKPTNRSKCGMDGPYVIATNLKGDVLSCHSTGHIIGSVYDWDNIDMNNVDYGHWSDRRECPTCPVLSLCNGACMTTTDQDAWYYTCNNEFHFNLAIFEAAFEMVFEETLISIEGDILRPEKSPVSLPDLR